MNIYDFDGTLYDGDSTFDFMRFLFGRYPRIALRMPYIVGEFTKYKCRLQDKTDFKEKLYRVFAAVPDMEREVRLFWESHDDKLKKYYKTTRTETDVVISASAEFLITPACRELGITRVIGSRVDMTTGKYTGLNCHGAEKIVRFRALYPDEPIEEFFSDSHADDPLARVAKRAWMVKGERLSHWVFPEEKQKGKRK